MRIAITHILSIIILVITSPCSGTVPKIDLSSEEKAWIEANNRVRVRVGNSPPFMLTDGKIQGIAIDYLTHVFNINGINIEYIRASEVTWPEALEYIKQHEVVDMVPTAKITEKRKINMIFTNEYIFAPWVIFSRSDADFIGSIDDLKGKTVSVEEGFVMHHVLKQDYPEIKLKVVSANLDNFAQIPIKDLSTGLVDAYIGNLLSTTHTIQTKGYTNVKVAAPTPFDNHNQAMAIRNDWPELASIINKTLASMTPEEHADIRNKWLSIRYEYGIDKAYVIKWVLGIMGIFFLIIGIVLTWNKRLKTEVIRRENIEKKLKESEKQLHSFLSNSPVGIGIWDKEFRYVYINEILQKINGPSLKEHLGKTIDEVLPNAAPIIRPVFEKILSTGEPAIEIELSGEVPANPGEITHYVLSYFPIAGKEETIKYIGGIIVDITDRKKSEEELRKQRDLFELVINSAPARISWKDLDLVYLGCNIHFAKDSGMEKPEDVIGRDDYALIWKEDAEVYRADDKHVISTGKPKLMYEEPFINKEGEKIWWLTNKIPLRDPDGKTIGVIATSENITERKNSEEDKLKLEARLQQAQKMESIGRLAGGVAHDYNNISSIIIGYTELALQQVEKDAPLHDDLVEILTAAKRSTDITRQLLAFARKQTIDPKVLDLNTTIERMLNMLRRLIGEDIELIWLPEADAWLVKIDPSQVDQILANLGVNARDAITDVGRVTIETKNITFDEDYCAHHAGYLPGDYFMLAVNDDGSGIEPEIVDKIFEPFFTTKGIGKGTGLGLSTVYGIVKQNNGFINVYSEPEIGTTIKIYLPRHVGQDVEAYSDNTVEIPLSRGEMVLLVEDDESILKLGKRILEDLGYTVLSSSSPFEAVELAKEHVNKLNLLITDVIMPEMNGRDLSEQLRSFLPSLKVLFISGYTADVIAHRGVLDDDVYFISKPFSKKDMAEKVREVLDSEIDVI